MITLGLLAMRTVCPEAGAASDESGVAFFENRIRPIFAEHCYDCHSSESKTVKGGLKLDTKEDFLKGGAEGIIVIPGQPDRSRLIGAVRHTDKTLQMPSIKAGLAKLPNSVIDDLERWVKMGAPYPETPASRKMAAPRLWALEPVKSPALPSVRNQAWPSTSLDRFILARLEHQGLQPAAQADKLTRIRRVTFDLTGLPPTPEEVADFQADSSVAAFAKVVDRLLSSPRYGEHWGRHWLDVARYADTAGDTADYPLPDAWRYRNYVVDSFNSDKPYDEFVREQVAGDILAKQGPRDKYAERVVATGYLALSRRFGFDSENYQHLTIQDTIDTLGQSFLGLTMGCARCHDHKFDPLSMQDYYGLYGIFASTRFSFPGSEQKGRHRALVPLAPAEESQSKWRELQVGYAQRGLTPPSVLRSLDDMDGDFAMQQPAAGGSYGVLVPPWLYEGSVSVKSEAQSPFKHFHPFGNTGVSVRTNAGAYLIRQTVQARHTKGFVYVNLEFRVATNVSSAVGLHRFLVGPHAGAPALEVFLSQQSLSLPGTPEPLVIPLPKPGAWHCLQLVLNLNSGTFNGRLAVPGESITIESRPLAKAYERGINHVALDSMRKGDGPLPGLEIDNIGLQAEPILPAATATETISARTPTTEALKAELQLLLGLDGDLEGQTMGKAPAAPFHPGPNSGVKIVDTAQSPFTNVYAAGKLGIHLPATAAGAYNGFGNNLSKPWKSETTEKLWLSFDILSETNDPMRSGTWRFHVGHGAGLPTVEFGLSATEFFRRSGDTRDRIASLQLGAWHQVQIALDLKARTYTGSLSTSTTHAEISGNFATGWDGIIDYIFIDSGGHIPGAKPALSVDNFALTDLPLSPLGQHKEPLFANTATGAKERINDIRQQLEQRSAEDEAHRQSLNLRLAAGPVGLAYAVSEGTPHNARLQLRGEPDRPGAEIQRGFIHALGNAEMPETKSGSGRLELAQWLTRTDNPLTARVLVNRIWQFHFGHGLVRTPNDFGSRSQPPSHPELLDHLATSFMREGWRLKAMHRLILLSSTWQQANASSESAAIDAPSPSSNSVRRTAVNLDAFNFFPRRRLSAEEIRDSILFVSGALDIAPGKEHPFPPPYQWGYSQHAPFAAVYDHDKRSIYLMVQRIKRHPFLALFDGADPNSSTAERRITTVPTQALYFLNDPFVHAKSIKFAERLQTARTTERGQMELASQLAFGRSPSQAELEDGAEFLAACRSELSASGTEDKSKAALAAYVRTLFGSNEFLHCD